MMPEDIKLKLKIQPFAPFRIHISDGATYDVIHSDAVLVTRTYVVIAPRQPKSGLPEGFVMCDPLHITRVTPLDVVNKKERRKRRG